MAKRRKVARHSSPSLPLPTPNPLRVIGVDPAGLGTADCKTIARGADNLDYAVKDGSGHPLTPHAEWFCTHLAGLLHIAGPPCAVLEMPPGGDTVFGSRWEGGVITPISGWDLVAKGIIKLADISPVLSRIYAFDHFIHNHDRHASNFMFRTKQSGYGILAYDYSRAWTFHGFPLPKLPFDFSDPNERTVHFQRQITSLLGKYIDSTEAAKCLLGLKAISARDVQRIIESHPSNWLPSRKRRAIIKWWSSKDFAERIDGIIKGIQDGTYL